MEYAIQVLDGVMFDGRTLRVSREKTNFNGGRKGGGFGSSRWAGADDGFRGPNRRERPEKKSDQQSSTAASMPKTEEEVVEQVRTVVSSEIADSPDQITSAIACTAAVSLLSSVDAFGLDRLETAAAASENEDLLNNASSNKSKLDEMTNQDFQSRCKLPLSELLDEYGEQDLDWKKKKQSTTDRESSNSVTTDDFQSRCKMPLSNLLAEYGEQDVDWKKQQPKHKPIDVANGNSRKDISDKSNTSKPMDNGMLAPVGKASIHLELVSFGYKYGAPSHSKKGFTYAHPLPPVDVRDLDRAPANVAKFNGLSYLVKRASLNPSEESDDTKEGEDDVKEQSSKTQSPMRKRANQIADEIVKVLVESIDEGGHGPISPLTMTISIGSEYGRHRSVVLVEHLAVVLRARLRRNNGKGFSENEESTVRNGIVKQLVSVDTRHRDVDAHHKDEEAFGEDLKREVRAAEKAKRRQEWEDDHW